MTRVVVLGQTVPNARSNGKEVVFGGMMRYLRDAVGPEQLHYLAIGLNERPQVDYSVILLPKPAAVQQMLASLGALLKQQRSLQESVLYSDTLRVRIQQALETLQPDVVICDTLRTGQYLMQAVPVTSAKRIIYLDDLFSLRYRKMLEVSERLPEAQINPLGNFGRLLPAVGRKLLESRQLQRTLLRWEAKLIARREDQAPRYFDRCLLISRAEVQLLRQRTGAQNIEEMPPLMDRPFRRARSYAGAAEFVFLGDLSLPHNEVSILHFLERQLPELLRIMPDFVLHIVGPGRSVRLEELARQYPRHLLLEGYVDDLDALLGRCCALIAPLLFGSGVKLKTLEALGRGLPIVCTSYGAEGIALQPGVHAIVEDRLEAYPERLKQLMDCTVNEAMSRAARAFFEEHYSPDMVYQAYHHLLLDRAGPDASVPVSGSG
ncbi:glycosyltransferase involved in cell wall biosynthesis [Deinobacterium chartae]|uniref:Glycosyltransferase involved in cell wall biosynthesis n=1 Tax=Deinobacterium chartae TaxID=521158 RepID=A0A841HY83_9DEIO|nr:glycosyltransferase family 4 protein [Deinobacterium chartae]MBB6097614.1 glycosyltransferase involved in cell wall biosynthesis [Deinobacterium chartae]